MSGIEIAGLLLGVFPLLISALEHYRKSVEVFDDWWQIKKEYKKCMNELKVQELAFQNNLERFLLPLIVDDDEIAALMNDPGGMRWEDQRLEKKLRDRLPKSYDLFLNTIEEMKSTMDSLKNELGISRRAFQEGLEAKIQYGFSIGRIEKLMDKSWLPNMEYQIHRMKFGFNRGVRAQLFAEFTRYNARLRELLDTNDNSVALKQSRQYMKNSTVKKTLWKFWRHATSLHNLLSQAWCCQCKHLHQACLFLHHETNVELVEFSICFLYAPSLIVDRCSWNWKEVNAQHINQEISDANLSLVVPQKFITQPLNPKSSLKSSMRHPGLSPGLSRPNVNWTNPPSHTGDSTHHPSGLTVITDLCSTIATCDPTSNTFGLLEGDEDSYVLQKGTKTRTPIEAYRTVSLESLLNKSCDFQLNRRQRYQVAYTLASSHLKLFPSPWLHSHWSKKDIIFNVDPQDPHTIHIDQPYLLQAVSTQEPISTPSRASRNRSLITLGILLLELCFDTALEDLDSKSLRHRLQRLGGQEIASPDQAVTLDLAVALEWSQEAYGEAGETYADAVTWCLRGQNPSVKDDNWRQALFANVVRPLQSCHEQLHPRTREDWLKPDPMMG